MTVGCLSLGKPTFLEPLFVQSRGTLHATLATNAGADWRRECPSALDLDGIFSSRMGHDEHLKDRREAKPSDPSRRSWTKTHHRVANGTCLRTPAQLSGVHTLAILLTLPAQSPYIRPRIFTRGSLLALGAIRIVRLSLEEAFRLTSYELAHIDSKSIAHESLPVR